MNTGRKYTNAIENKMLISGITLDLYGDELLKIGFDYLEDSGKITEIFGGTISVN